MSVLVESPKTTTSPAAPTTAADSCLMMQTLLLWIQGQKVDGRHRELLVVDLVRGEDGRPVELEQVLAGELLDEVGRHEALATVKELSREVSVLK